VLRAHEVPDAAALHAAWADERVWRYVGEGQPTPYESDLFVDHVELQRDALAARGWCALVVTDREAGEVYGECGLYPFADTGDIELGYRLGVAAWGRGIGGEAAAAVLSWAFDELALDDLICVVQDDNTASWHIAERLGFELERVEERDYGARKNVRTRHYRWFKR